MPHVSLQSFCASKNAQTLSDVRVNSNQYPYIFIDEETYYFSKNASAQVDAGTTILSIAKTLYVIDVVNATGEPRKKLTFTEPSGTSVADLFD